MHLELCRRSNAFSGSHRACRSRAQERRGAQLRTKLRNRRRNVHWVCDQGILYRGCNSAANSAVRYCLGVTEVDPARISVLFERFISVERRELHDIDIKIDFEPQWREEVVQHICYTYSHNRAALTVIVTPSRTKSARRDLGTAFGLSDRESRRSRQRQPTAGLSSGSERHACRSAALAYVGQCCAILPSPPEPTHRRLRHLTRKSQLAGIGGELFDEKPHSGPVGEGRPGHIGGDHG